MPRTKRIIDSDIKKEMQGIANEFKRFRAANGLSQKWLAEITGVSRRTIQCIESGLIIPQQRTIDAFKAKQMTYASEGKPTGKRKTSKKNHHGEGEF